MKLERTASAGPVILAARWVAEIRGAEFIGKRRDEMNVIDSPSPSETACGRVAHRNCLMMPFEVTILMRIESD